MTDKPKALEVEETKVKPPELPDKAGSNYGPPGSNKGDAEVAAETEETAAAETEETPELPDDRPRAERRRSQREIQKAENEQKAALKKYEQLMAKPIRFRDMGTVVNQVYMQLHPLLKKMQDEIDKLGYLPDYLADIAEEFEVETPISISHFEEWFAKVKADLEAEDTSSGEEGEPVEGQAKAAEEAEESREDVSPPETEETQ